MKVHGSCHCGNITYEAEADPETIIICSCTKSASVAAPVSSFQLSSGDPVRFVGIAGSGAIRVESACDDCGSVIYSSAPGEPRKYWLYAVWLNERSELRPKKLIRCRLPCGTRDKKPLHRMEKRTDLTPNPEQALVRVSSTTVLFDKSRILQEWSRALREALKQTTASTQIEFSKTVLQLPEREARELRPK